MQGPSFGINMNAMGLLYRVLQIAMLDWQHWLSFISLVIAVVMESWSYLQVIAPL